MYDELVKRLRYDAELLSQDGWAAGLFTEAADAIEELSRVADAIPHVCECCVGCEVESGGCDRAFVLSPKRAREYLSKPRWIPVTERLPEPYTWVLVCAENHKVAFDAFYDGVRWQDAVLNGLIVTHWMPLPEPPKEES